MNELFNDLDEMMRSMFSSWELPLRMRRASDKPFNGLKGVIDRPHNLSCVTDEDGNVVSYNIDVVYTPFKKEDIKIEHQDGVITVSVGNSKEKTEDDGRAVVYCGISGRAFEFKLYVKNLIDNEEIDVENVKATADEGVLHIEFPAKRKEPLESKAIQILVS